MTKNKFSMKKVIMLNVPFMAVLLAVIIALATLATTYKETISRFLYGVGGSSSAETVAQGLDLCEEIVDEGVVLLKNQNNTLPLAKMDKVNVFGWAAYDWLTGGFGSSFSNTSLERLKLFPALKKAGIQYNETLEKMYKDFYSKPDTNYGGPWDEYRGDVSVSGNNKFTLHEPGAAYYTSEIINEAKAFSDTALVVIGRVGGEGKDLRKYQEKQVQTNKSNAKIKDESRHYLELSVEEEEMIAAAKSACSNVIVILNTSNTMELNFVEDEAIDACLLTGLTGLNGVNSVINVLKGTVNPSGRTVDIYAKMLERTPSFATSGYGNGLDGPLKYNESTKEYGAKGYYDAYVDYSDSIYVGYRYYETFASTITQSVDAQEKIYDAFVQYPFGYGLSYTSFEWEVAAISPAKNSTLNKDGKIELTLKVTNTGTVAGKDVVQVYYTAPYTKGGIEKPYVALVAFAKTGLIEPDTYQTVDIEFDVRDMASYDCYDLNDNKHTGYELDAGNYEIKLMKNSHELQDKMKTSSKTEAVIPYYISQTINYDTDDKTGAEVKNRFTGDSAAEGMPIDGSKESVPVTYLSRANNMVSTLPKAQARRNRNATAYNIAKAQEPTSAQLAEAGLQDATMPATGESGTAKFEDAFTANGYNDAIWEQLIKQVTKAELFQLIRDGYFKTAELASIGKEQYADLDGISGLNTRIFSNAKCQYVLYPNETLMAQTWNTHLAYQMGISVGQEASDAGISGWYAPGGNVHRSPFGGRNFEYFSEDPLLAGKFTANVVLGAKNKGLYAYIKHFAINENETMREGLFTWLTEQALREIYLKPFELAVKEGGSNALMTSMNRIGAVWIGASRALCTDIVRNEWGFKGTLVTDWLDSGTDYMPAYKGIWAGNDIWLNNAENNRIFADSKYNDNAAFVTLAQKVARDVMFTYVDTLQAKNAYIEATGGTVTPPTVNDNGGTQYNYSWMTYVVIIEVVLGGALIAWGVLVVLKILKNKTPKKGK